jgi:hypothetical protein
VVVLQPRPSRVRETIQVSTPREARTPDDPGHAAVLARLLRSVRADG